MSAPSPVIVIFLWHSGHLVFELKDMDFLYPHSLSWQTSILPFFPLTSSRNFPHSGHFFPVTLSWRNFPSEVFISFIIFLVYSFISLKNTSLLSLFSAILLSSSSHLAVKSGVFKSLGARLRSCFPFDVTNMEFPLFSSMKFEKSLSMISALVATVPRPPVSVRVFDISLSEDFI